jgi:16S rRNA (guanine(966)-N(2))-methyltransferase RsmD
VIGGEFRSRRLKSLSGLDVRPTPDRLRETLFNVLAPRIADTVFVDAYAGTGAVGIEALSRGARRAVFMERARGAAEIIRENLNSLGILDRATILRGSAALLLPKHEADIVFIDPPYTKAGEYEAALEAARAPLVIAQHSPHQQLADRYGTLVRSRVLTQGDNILSFYLLE